MEGARGTGRSPAEKRPCREEPGLPEKEEAAFSPGRVDSEVPTAPKPPCLLAI